MDKIWSRLGRGGKFLVIGSILGALLSGCIGGGGGGSNSSGSGSNGATNAAGNAGPLEGCWYSSALGTSWSFTGTTGEIRTASNNGVPGEQITGLEQMTFTSTSMTYYINRAAVTSNGVYLYDNAITPPRGPNTQPYTLSSTGTSFTAGNGTYVKNAGTCPGGTGPGTGSTPTTGQIAVYTTRTTTPTGSISVSIDNASAGTLTQFVSGTPTCGSAGTLTQTLAAGSHTLSAASGTLTWGPSTFTITAGGCLAYALN